jgi:hypothetical protein
MVTQVTLDHPFLVQVQASQPEEGKIFCRERVKKFHSKIGLGEIEGRAIYFSEKSIILLYR